MGIIFHIKEKNLDAVKEIIKKIEDIEESLSGVNVDIDIEVC